MRILLIMDPGVPVPPKLYGGHERLVYMFAEEYIKMGHEVTILAGPDSYCSGKTIHFGRNGLPKTRFQTLREVLWAIFFLAFNHKKYDLIHNFGRLIYLLPILNKSVKKLMTYGRPVASKNISFINKLPSRNLIFTGCSDYLVSTGSVAGDWRTVYNAIDFSKYQLKERVEEDSPLIFLGRLDRIKGCHNAIAFAKYTGKKLWIAGNISTLKHEKIYFETEIVPHIDNNQIMYLGSLNDTQKNEYLGKSLALLMFIEWDEPFGMVMVEAMACGTPVLGFKRGSVAEVVEEGITGFVIDDLNQAHSKLKLLYEFDRKKCREKAESKFHSSVIANTYLNLK
ncbi:MAG: glycosyltransferase family 4 protein [Bacteroidetes bacterium]|nr:MAG: glycosyltransferase family 4 protein [Bacteroidota bacterium]